MRFAQKFVRENSLGMCMNFMRKEETFVIVDQNTRGKQKMCSKEMKKFSFDEEGNCD